MKRAILKGGGCLVVLLVFIGCAAAVPAKRGDAPRYCWAGGDKWKMAVWRQAHTEIVGEASWDVWREGTVIALRRGDVEVNLVVRARLWAEDFGGRSAGLGLTVEQHEFDLPLISSARGSCYFFSSNSLKLTGYDGGAFHLVLFTAPRDLTRVLLPNRVWLNPHGGPNFGTP